MARGSLASARNPLNAAITARYPSAPATIAALDNTLPHPSTPAPIIAAPPPSPTPLDTRPEGMLHRAVRDAALAPLRAVLIARPESVRDVDRQQRTALHIAADEGHAILAVYLLDARADPNARDRQGFTPVDCAECWAARNAARAPACLSTLAVIFCFISKRSRADEVADPPNYTLVHHRQADTARRMTLIAPRLDEPWASAGDPERQSTPTPAILDADGSHTITTPPPTTDRDSLRPPLLPCAPDSQAPLDASALPSLPGTAPPDRRGPSCLPHPHPPSDSDLPLAGAHATDPAPQPTDSRATAIFVTDTAPVGDNPTPNSEPDQEFFNCIFEPTASMLTPSAPRTLAFSRLPQLGLPADPTPALAPCPPRAPPLSPLGSPRPTALRSPTPRSPTPTDYAANGCQHLANAREITPLPTQPSP